MAAEQLPSTAGYTVGGQSAVAGYVVGQEVDGFEEVGESKQTPAGAHACDITYSRRPTKSFVFELEHGTDPEAYMSGGFVDSSYAPSGTPAWEIRSVSRVNTRGPVQLNLELVSLTDSITAPA